MHVWGMEDKEVIKDINEEYLTLAAVIVTTSTIPLCALSRTVVPFIDECIPWL